MTSNSNAAADKSPFSRWLKSVPAAYLALNVAIATVVPLFAPEQFLPEPLTYLRNVPPIVVVIGLLMTWTTRKSLQKNLPHIALMMCTGLVLWILLLVLFVRGPVDEKFFLVGYSRQEWVKEVYTGWPDELIIADNDGTWGALHEVWGGSFIVVTVAYTASYTMVLLGVVTLLGGSTLVKTRRSANTRF
jgi:hypothetical protein